jgi:hypothetical protein
MDRIDAPNWFMAMYSHPPGDSTQIGSRLMKSLNPLTEGGRGRPRLVARKRNRDWTRRAVHNQQSPRTLDRYYGDDLGYGFEFFLRIRPSLHSHGEHTR